MELNDILGSAEGRTLEYKRELPGNRMNILNGVVWM